MLALQRYALTIGFKLNTLEINFAILYFSHLIAFSPKCISHMMNGILALDFLCYVEQKLYNIRNAQKSYFNPSHIGAWLMINLLDYVLPKEKFLIQNLFEF